MYFSRHMIVEIMNRFFMYVIAVAKAVTHIGQSTLIYLLFCRFILWKVVNRYLDHRLHLYNSKKCCSEYWWNRWMTQQSKWQHLRLHKTKILQWKIFWYNHHSYFHDFVNTLWHDYCAVQQFPFSSFFEVGFQWRWHAISKFFVQTIHWTETLIATVMALYP